MKQRGLGRGLDALMGGNARQEGSEGVLQADIFLVDNNKNQPRKDFDEEKLAELAQSIRTHGIMQPVLVYENNGRYTIVAGERRFRAAKLAGLKKIPVIVREFTEREILELSLIENIQREDLNPIEQAAALHELVTQYNLRQEDVAERVGKSRSAIANLMRLLSLPDGVKRMVRGGALSAGHARCLLALEDPKKIQDAAVIVSERALSVRQAEDMVRDMLAVKSKRPGADKNMSAEIRDAQETLSEALETKVKIHGDLHRGHISIDYYNREQLGQLYDYLTDK